MGKLTLHCVVKNLSVKDIRLQVLDVVLKDMSTDAVIKYIEAKESGKQTRMYLEGGEAVLNKIGFRQNQKEEHIIYIKVQSDKMGVRR